ncbi:nucleotide kinase domain-containing protein [Hymenobacter sp. B81]|uniref:nucleotide kinase domain-containing protein n=1 Tax=Hymenobacter sp. B81 TaxID=3344878 RepID=UPI0037DCF4FC
MLIGRKKPQKSKLYEHYWYFAAKRQDVFLKRLEKPTGPWTSDPVLNSYRFTNVFRALDRVTQYLIGIQAEQQDSRNVLFNTLLFKLFNKIETYRYLERALGPLRAEEFDLARYDELLTYRMAAGHTIYSGAYIMPSAGRVYGHKLKHTNHLALLAQMLADRLEERVQACQTLKEVYDLLIAYPSLGKFLAFQYAIDLNYSSLTDFSEMDFVVAGPGAINGIHKCFSSLGDYSYEEVIRLMTEEQEAECARLGLTAPSLYGRPLQLIDCQNLFCEVDKYLRVTHPETVSAGGQKRIKQRFTASTEPLTYLFPPKWGLTQSTSIEWPQPAIADIFS